MASSEGGSYCEALVAVDERFPWNHVSWAYWL